MRGELDVGMAVMLRRLEGLQVGPSSLMGNVGNARPLVESLHAVETVWLEEA